MTDETATQPAAGLENIRADNFSSIYANNAVFEASAWDLKIIFGELEQSPKAAAVVRQTVAVTIPWAQAKLALYWLRLHVELMEMQTGKIPIRKDLIPVEPPLLTPEQEKDPDAKRLLDLYRKLREEFVASL